VPNCARAEFSHWISNDVIHHSTTLIVVIIDRRSRAPDRAGPIKPRVHKLGCSTSKFVRAILCNSVRCSKPKMSQRLHWMNAPIGYATLLDMVRISRRDVL
jgi:hypothetical protein